MTRLKGQLLNHCTIPISTSTSSADFYSLLYSGCSDVELDASTCYLHFVQGGKSVSQCYEGLVQIDPLSPASDFCSILK